MLPLDKENIEEMSGHTVEESILKYIQPFTQSLAPSCTFLQVLVIRAMHYFLNQEVLIHK